MPNSPTITTPRLLLRQSQMEDVPYIVKYADNQNISDKVLNLPYPYLEEHAHGWIKMAAVGFESKVNYIFAIHHLEKDHFIGGIGLHLDESKTNAELGYWIAEPFWNMGIASEAGKAILQFGFENLGLQKIYASHFLFNPASERVLQKIGMQFQKVLMEHHMKNGKLEDVGYYELTLKNWES